MDSLKEAFMERQAQELAVLLDLARRGDKEADNRYGRTVKNGIILNRKGCELLD